MTTYPALLHAPRPRRCCRQVKRGPRRLCEARHPNPSKDIPGFCNSASLEDIRKHGHVLTPGRYVGAEDVEDDGEPFTLSERAKDIERKHRMLVEAAESRLTRGGR